MRGGSSTTSGFTSEGSKSDGDCVEGPFAERRVVRRANQIVHSVETLLGARVASIRDAEDVEQRRRARSRGLAATPSPLERGPHCGHEPNPCRH